MPLPRLVSTHVIAALLAVASATPVVAARKPVISGPVAFTVARIHDGDSFSGEAEIWPGHSVSVTVRIRGIDAPELNSRCETERAMAKAARQSLMARLPARASVRLFNIGTDKYSGRVVADVEGPGRTDLAGTLLQGAHFRRYEGGKRFPWCK